MTTDAQTEARAIALAAAGQVHDNEDARCVETLVEKLVATALAAKDAELVEMERQREVERISKEHARRECERAEAQLAEANKALADYDRWLSGRDAYIVQKGLWQNFVASLPGSPAARRALEEQGGE